MLREGYTIIEADNGQTALDKLLPGGIDLVILDVMMPVYDGWTVCREIRKSSQVPIIMLTAKGEEVDQLFGFEIGADEYITKPFSPRVLTARVNALFRRCESSPSSAYGALQINHSGRFVSIADCRLDLSPKEYDLLMYLAANSGRALSREQILNHVWNYDYLGDLRTVDTHINRLRTKLGSEGRLIQTLILGYAEGLKENVAKDEESKNYYCTVIFDEANRMDRLIKDLLNLSQIESGFFHLEKINFDLSALIDDIVLKYRTVLSDKQISLQLKKTPQTFASGDVLRIEQVIVNLLNNAIDHVANSRIIRISITQNTDKIRVYVYNTGKHIPEDKIADIWLSFYKVDQSRTRGLGGYGLGLSIVRAIQELHGNGYGAKNIEGGILFWFELNKAV